MWSQPLRFIDDTRLTPAENLKVDDELLQEVDANPDTGCLRLWEQPSYAVIVGRSNAIEREVHVAACLADDVPIWKRSSGGGAVVLGPGCLCYSLILPLTDEHRSLGVSKVTAEIMRRLAAALSRPEAPVSVAGISDLVIGDRKFSGNSQRWRKRALLHHGTVLYDFDLDRVAHYLAFPSRVPDYRSARGHLEFVDNLEMPRTEIIARLCAAWNAREAQG